MGRRRTSTSKQGASIIDGALAALGAEELRELVRDLLSELDEQAHGRAIDVLVSRATKNGSGWAPASPSDEAVSEILAFAEAATRAGYANPSEVDGYLRQGSNAFLRKDYSAVVRIFHALLPPIGGGDIDLGQDEMIDEVLSVSTSDCASQYVVAVYMTSPLDNRAEAVRAAIDEVSDAGYFQEPIRELESVAVEPLPELDAVLPLWRALIEEEAGRERRHQWDRGVDEWLREVVRRMEGAEGMAKLARSSRRAVDLRSWCRTLVGSNDWKAALSAYEEAAEIVDDREYVLGEFLDGAALAAQELGREDLPERLSRAWRAAPTMVRLRRWLGSSANAEVARQRAAEALAACPQKAHRQRALFQVLLGDIESAARLLSAAPGLGWSDSEHPGHLLIPLFRKLLGCSEATASPYTWTNFDHGMGFGEQRLTTPEIDQILELAGVEAVTDGGARKAAIEAMRRAAEKRLEGVTGEKRRRHYDHAASLVAASMAVDPSPEGRAWLSEIRDEYRRFPALKRELERYVR
jgi:hypothetical protein